jgi:glycopeptide antibiotics resistance protein
MKHKIMLKDITIQVLFTLYVYTLFKIILFKFSSIDMRFLWHQLKISLRNTDHMSRQLQKGNLIPFKEISRTIHDISSHGLINLIGNFAIFMPYGILLGLMLRNKKVSFIDAFILSLGLSLILELAQAFFSIGRYDVDDLILNSSGGLIGFIIFKLFALLVTTLSANQARGSSI